MASIPFYPGEPKEYTLRKLTDAANARATGRGTFDGTGLQVAFVIPHGLGVVPASVFVSAGSNAATGAHYATADATNITVTFTAAPASGTDNVVLNWTANK